MSITVITNNVPRDVIHPYEIQFTDRERQDFDYLDFSNDDDLCRDFVRYKGELYDLEEFERVPDLMLKEMKFWDGYRSDTFFSGILIKYVDDFERVIMGRYYS